MTRHALAAHAPDGAIFAVSSFGPGASGNRPPAELHPLGLEGPLGWVAEQLEARDRAEMERLWELAPADLPRLGRCVPAYERRYPRSNRSFEFRDRLKKLERKRGWRRMLRLAAAAIVAVGGLAGSDLLGVPNAPGRSRRAGEARRRRSRGAGPSCSSGIRRSRSSGRRSGREARQKQAEWQVKAAGVQVANGTAPADLRHAARAAQGPGAAARRPRSAGRGRPGAGQA